MSDMADDRQFTHIRLDDKTYMVQWLGEPCTKAERRYGGNLYVVGHEFGPTHLIGARHFEAAYEWYLDNLIPMASEYVYIAYDFPSMGSMDKFSALHRKDPAAAYAWVKAEGIELNTDGITVPTDFPELIEGYEYQPNATGSGIVDVGVHVWFRVLGVEV